MNQIERDLLNIVQNDFPLYPRPYAIIADRLGISEERCIELLSSLISRGILREIRPVINWKKAGFIGILIGMEVAIDKIDAVASEINTIPGVTHNYKRDNRLNLWCTLTCESEHDKQHWITFMRTRDGVTDLKEFASEKTYKIGMVLDV